MWAKAPVADVRLAGLWRDARGLVDEAGQLVQTRHRAGAEDLPSELNRQVRGNGDEVDIPAPLADAVDGPLHLDAAGVDRGQRVGDGEPRVVVGVDGEGGNPGVRTSGLRFQETRDGLYRVGDLLGQRAAVGVAEDQPGRAAGDRGGEGLQRVLRVGFVAVKEVLGVVEDLLYGGGLGTERHRVADHRQVLVPAHREHLIDMQVPGLADDRDDRCPSFNQRLHPRVVLRFDPLAPGHPERTDPRVLPSHLAGLLEEGDVLGVGKRVAALDVVEAQVVEQPRDIDLIDDGKRDAQPLRPVAEGGVVQLDAAGIGGWCFGSVHGFASNNKPPPGKAGQVDRMG